MPQYYSDVVSSACNKFRLHLSIYCRSQANMFLDYSYLFFNLLGYYCTSGVDTDTPSGSGHTGIGGQCYKGHECPIGTALPQPCKAGYYAPNVGMSSCLVCPKG